MKRISHEYRAFNTTLISCRTQVSGVTCSALELCWHFSQPQETARTFAVAREQKKLWWLEMKLAQHHAEASLCLIKMFHWLEHVSFLLWSLCGQYIKIIRKKNFCLEPHKLSPVLHNKCWPAIKSISQPALYFSSGLNAFLCSSLTFCTIQKAFVSLCKADTITPTEHTEQPAKQVRCNNEMDCWARILILLFTATQLLWCEYALRSCLSLSFHLVLASCALLFPPSPLLAFQPKTFLPKLFAPQLPCSPNPDLCSAALLLRCMLFFR